MDPSLNSKNFFAHLPRSDRGKFLILTSLVLIFILGSYLHYLRGYYGAGQAFVHSQGVDDAYITYRYGWNLVQFHTLSWNESGYRRTEGFTNPLWVLLSAIWSIPGKKEMIYPLSVLTSVTFSALLLLLLGQLVYVKNSRSPAAMLGLIMVAAVPAIWLHTTSGLESGVFGLGLAVLAYWALFCEVKSPQITWMAILATTLGLLRSDGFIYLTIVLMATSIANPKAWKAIAFGLMISSAALIAWRYFTFGALLPNTVIAKVNFSLRERLPIGLVFLGATLFNSGLALHLLLGLAGLKFEYRRKALAGVFIILAWLSYYLYVGGDAFIERHLIGLYILAAAISAPLWRVAKPLTRGLFAILLLFVSLISLIRYGDRFDYLAVKPNDPWVMLGQAVAAERNRYGVLISFAAGKIPFYAGGDCIDSIGLNDPYLATIKRSQFVPGHSSGDEQAAIELIRNHPAGVYTTFSYLDQDILHSPEDISLWVKNLEPEESVHRQVTRSQWDQAIATGNIYIWSVISKPKRIAVDNPP